MRIELVLSTALGYAQSARLFYLNIFKIAHLKSRLKVIRQK